MSNLYSTILIGILINKTFEKSITEILRKEVVKETQRNFEAFCHGNLITNYLLCFLTTETMKKTESFTYTISAYLLHQLHVLENLMWVLAIIFATILTRRATIRATHKTHNNHNTLNTDNDYINDNIHNNYKSHNNQQQRQQWKHRSLKTITATTTSTTTTTTARVATHLILRHQHRVNPTLFPYLLVFLALKYSQQKMTIFLIEIWPENKTIHIFLNLLFKNQQKQETSAFWSKMGCKYID